MAVCPLFWDRMLDLWTEWTEWTQWTQWTQWTVHAIFPGPSRKPDGQSPMPKVQCAKPDAQSL